MAMPQYQPPQPAPPGQAVPPPLPPPFYYTPQPGSPEADLLAQLDEAKAAEAEAKARTAGLVKQIEGTVCAAVAAQLPPGSILPGIIHIAGSPFWQGRVMRWKVPRIFNRKRFARDFPQIEPAYVEDGDGFWQLDPAK